MPNVVSFEFFCGLRLEEEEEIELPPILYNWWYEASQTFDGESSTVSQATFLKQNFFELI